MAGDGLQGIQDACDARPDLIILDFHMPGGGGSAVYACLRELRPTADTPIVFLTAVPIDEVKSSIPLGANTYFISKPAGLDAIVPVIRAALQEGP